MGKVPAQFQWSSTKGDRGLAAKLKRILADGKTSLPLEVALGPEIRRIEMTEVRQRFEIPAEHAPASVTLDPNTWMLMEAALREKR